MSLSISLAETDQDRAACMQLRREVFILEQSVPQAEETDGLDDECIHFLVRLEGKPVAASRVRYLKDKAKIQRVCVSKDKRGSGFGGRLIAYMIDHLSAENRAAILYLESQVHAISFYENLGFTAYGDVFMDAGIPHRKMEKPVDTILAPHRLAIYGTLAPGAVNESQLSELSGEWISGKVSGHQIEISSGLARGCPGLTLDPDASKIDVFVFQSKDLPNHWERLDQFEGPQYRRVLTRVETVDGFVTAYIYEFVS